MTLLNALLGRAADAVLRPVQELPAVAVMLVLGLVTALVVLAVMKVSSNQTTMAAAKRRIHADLLEMRLYHDDVRALLRAQGALVRDNAAYIWLSLVPLLITALPLTLAIAQVQSWYGYAGLPAGQPALVTIDLGSGALAALPAIEAPGVEVEGAPLYFPTLGQVVWRITPRAAGTHLVRVRLADGATFDKTLHVGDGIARRSPARTAPDLLTQVLYPSEPPLPEGSPVAAIRVDYPDRALTVFGFDLHWLWLYLLATFAFVLALRKPLGVVI